MQAHAANTLARALAAAKLAEDVFELEWEPPATGLTTKLSFADGAACCSSVSGVASIL